MFPPQCAQRANVPFQLDVRTVCLQRAIETRQREAQRQQLRALMAQKAEEEAQKRRRAEADARAVEAEAEVKRQAELEEAKRHAAAAAVRWQHRAAWRDCVRHIVHGTLHVACGVFHIARHEIDCRAAACSPFPVALNRRPRPRRSGAKRRWRLRLRRCKHARTVRCMRRATAQASVPPQPANPLQCTDKHTRQPEGERIDNKRNQSPPNGHEDQRCLLSAEKEKQRLEILSIQQVCLDHTRPPNREHCSARYSVSRAHCVSNT
jgi:hypothetical protein